MDPQSDIADPKLDSLERQVKNLSRLVDTCLADKELLDSKVGGLTVPIIGSRVGTKDSLRRYSFRLKEKLDAITRPPEGPRDLVPFEPDEFRREVRFRDRIRKILTFFRR